MTKYKFRRFLLAGTAAIALPASAWAQGATTQVAAADTGVQLAAADTQLVSSGKDGGVETVIVTARHRAENNQDIPVSLQAISGETLERKGTIDLQSLIAQTPGLNSTGGNPRNFSVLIRGIGYAPTAADGLDNAIGVYIDGVYQARPGQVLQDLVDVDSFEVLRGPQGTLFGRNAAAGALNITTNKPSFTPSETFELSAGNYSFFQGNQLRRLAPHARQRQFSDCGNAARHLCSDRQQPDRNRGHRALRHSPAIPHQCQR
jgi:iron complex outermembrane receptor protein